jgi:hypothetical protein
MFNRITNQPKLKTNMAEAALSPIVVRIEPMALSRALFASLNFLISMRMTPRSK